MIEMRKLKQLIELMKDNDLSELDLRDEKEQITLKRPTGGHPAMMMPAAMAPAAAPPVAQQSAAEGSPPAAPAPQKDENLVEIVSPMVGTFYTAASPDAEAYVHVGSRVEADAVVCIIEAMKVFNEIKAEVVGTVEQILVGNGQAVEFGQPLMTVRKA